MIKRILLSPVLFIILVAQQASAQHLLSDSLLVHYTASQADSLFLSYGIPITVHDGISCYRILYSTQNAQQTDTTVVSGLIVVTDHHDCPLPIASYDHGTTTLKYDVPSFLNFESVISMILAEEGYFSIAPDYLGMGVNQGTHPYLHARSEAQVTIDMIFAAKAFAANNNIVLSDQLFLSGYSQGGHSCMATHRAIQQNYAGQLTVTASAPGSGPYNLSGIQSATLAQNVYYAEPAYVPYLTFGYQSVYANLYDSLSQFFFYPWDSILPPLYNGLNAADSINLIMPHHVDSFMVDSQLIWYNVDTTTDPLRLDLQDNDVYAWLPQAPIQMVYCTLDEQVFYQNTLFALNYFQSEGDTLVWAVDGGADTHENCIVPYMFNTVSFFGRYRISENTLSLTLTADSASTPTDSNATVSVSVSGGTGYTINWSTGSTDSIVTGLSDGTYTVTVTDANGCPKVRTINTNTGVITDGIKTVNQSAPQVQLFPNPSSGMMTIRVTDFRPDAITIYDVNGQKVDEEKFNSQLDVSRLDPGIYMIEIKNDQATARSRFVKM
jgi:hypothetical protein